MGEPEGPPHRHRDVLRHKMCGLARRPSIQTQRCAKALAVWGGGWSPPHTAAGVCYGTPKHAIQVGCMCWEHTRHLSGGMGAHQKTAWDVEYTKSPP